jgi:hypothetical protein
MSKGERFESGLISALAAIAMWEALNWYTNTPPRLEAALLAVAGWFVAVGVRALRRSRLI